MTPVMIRSLGHRRSGMLKSYFVELILLTFLKYVFKKNGYVVESNYFKITPLPTSVCFKLQINIIHKYTETEKKYIGKINAYGEQM